MESIDANTIEVKLDYRPANPGYQRDSLGVNGTTYGLSAILADLQDGNPGTARMLLEDIQTLCIKATVLTRQTGRALVMAAVGASAAHRVSLGYFLPLELAVDLAIAVWPKDEEAKSIYIGGLRTELSELLRCWGFLPRHELEGLGKLSPEDRAR